MTEFDPYAELDLPRDATLAMVRSAFRRLAKKTHPDVGGSDEAFARVNRAMAVLGDTERRAKYDETGVAEDDKPDNALAAAMGIVKQHIGQIIMRYEERLAQQQKSQSVNGFTFTMQPVDPRRFDMFREIEASIATEIKDATKRLADGERHVKFVEDLARRVVGSHPSKPVENMLNARLHEARRRIEQGRDAIKNQEAALEIVKAYRMDTKVDP